MRNVRDILRLHSGHQLTGRQIAQSLGLAHSTVMGVLHRAETLGLGWPLPADLDDAALEGKFHPPTPGETAGRGEPSWEQVYRELHRRKAVTLRLLWQEYRRDYPNGYQYSRFCDLYRRWEGKLDVVLRQPHRAGEKMFLDWAGLTLSIVDPTTGQVQDVHIFVATLGMSNLTYLEGALVQTLPIWIDLHIHAFEYFMGVSEIVVSDSTKTAVTRACRYEPDLNRTYQDLMRHYGTVAIPTRPRTPRDNAKAENAVQNVERVILAPLRDRIFFSLAEINEALREGRERLNDLPFQKLPGSRRTQFETLEKPALRPLPPERYELATWKTVRANIDYHCQVIKNFYSVPHQLVHEKIEARLTATTVELFYKGRRVASHVRLWGIGQFTTDPAHRPLAHQKHLEWTPSRLIAWGHEHGPEVGACVAALLASKPHPEQGYRASLGVMRLGKRYGVMRLNAACARALAIEAVSYHSIKSILETGLDRQPLPGPSVQLVLDTHVNVRGPAYYAAGVDGPQNGVDAVMSADPPVPAEKPAPQMPQETRPGAEEASGYPLGPAHSHDGTVTIHGAASPRRS